MYSYQRHDFSTLSSQTLLSKDRQCCESWRDAELGVRAVCAVGATTDEDRWVDLLSCSLHCDTAESCLTNDTLTTFSSSLSATTTDAGRHRPSAARPTTAGIECWYHGFCSLTANCRWRQSAAVLLIFYLVARSRVLYHCWSLLGCVKPTYMTPNRT